MLEIYSSLFKGPIPYRLFDTELIYVGKRHHKLLVYSQFLCFAKFNTSLFFLFFVSFYFYHYDE